MTLSLGAVSLSLVGVLLAWLWRTWWQLFSLAVLAASVANVFWLDHVSVTRNSMAPTLVAGDRVLFLRDAKPRLGDIMFCQRPGEPRRGVDPWTIGRVVGMTGDTVGTHAGNLLLNGAEQPSELLSRAVSFDDSVSRATMRLWSGTTHVAGVEHAWFRSPDKPFSISKTRVTGGMYLLGDNRLDSQDDSRDYGPIDPAACRGRVVARIWPHATAGSVRHGWFESVH